MARVVVGLSGGVDSSVAAYLLQQEGHEVIGMFMRNWHDSSVTISDECPWIDDSNDAMRVAEHLGIPFQVIDLSTEYKARIVDYMFREYAAGRTPNPDILCNREIKFDVFLKAALKLGADFVATGHYCRKRSIETARGTEHQLLSGRDPNKDQSYFLCQLTQEQLAKSLFPIGNMLKPEVRELALQIGLPTAEKKDSQGLCFIGKVKLPVFLQQQLKENPGNIIEVAADNQRFAEFWQLPHQEQILHPFRWFESDGKIIGTHQGVQFYTVGQRKGLQVGGKPLPLFILQTDSENNILYVGQGENHPGMYFNGLIIKREDIHWVNPRHTLTLGDSIRVRMRIRYRQALFDATLQLLDQGLLVFFDTPVKNVTPGQFAAFYVENELIGSGVIHS
jgi:tRNA-uridine 2-sulfurtransferase